MAAINLAEWWQEMEKMIMENSLRRLDVNILHMLFDNAIKEKERTETDQIIARVMYKQCFSHNKENEKKMITLKKKFRYLALYYYRMQDYETFGLIVMSSIIREWPVEIFYVDEENANKPTFFWDRAPFSIAMKDGNIRKEGDKYVMRVLALEGEDIGKMVTRAEARTQLLAVDEKGQETPTETAVIIELNREGVDKKREAPPTVTAPVKKRGGKGKSKEEAQSPAPSSIFETWFQHLPGNNGEAVFVAKQSKLKEEFIATDGSNNVYFSINNISVIDPSTRSTVTQKYILKSHFEFDFMGFGTPFSIKSSDYYSNESFVYQLALKSMTFEASSNASTHWKKSFPAIWDAIFQYYSKLGELDVREVNSAAKEEPFRELYWKRVKEMIRHFISCRSEFYVRPLMDTELRTVSRMILARRLDDFNEHFKKVYRKNGWIIDMLPQQDKETIQDFLLGKRIKRFHPDKTFTHHLNSVMQSVVMADEFVVKQGDFTNNLLVFTNGEREAASCTIHTWLHATSEIIAGPILHFQCPQTTIKMFNKHLITVRSAESARRTINKIVQMARNGQRSANVLMIRIDEREDFRLLFEMIDPSDPDPYHFGFYHAKSIKETKMAYNKQESDSKDVERATAEGVISKTKQELCGLFAVLKTGYLREFHKIVKSSVGELIIYPLYKSDKASCPVYQYDFQPADMVDKEINPLIGPRTTPHPGDLDIEKLSVVDSMVTKSVASMRMDDKRARSMQQQQPLQMSLQDYIPAYSPQFQQSPQFAYPLQPQHANVQQIQSIVHQHNVYYMGDPPPYSSQNDQVTFSNQGVQVQPPFTPPDSAPIDPQNLLGMSNPNYISM